MRYYIGLLVCLLLATVSCSQKATIDLSENQVGYITDRRYRIVKDAFLYALLSVNAYEAEENSPFRLPEYIKEIRHNDSQVSDPGRKYVDSKVYDNGTFQAKIFEIIPEPASSGTTLEVVIAFRGTQKLLSGDILLGTLTGVQRRKAVLLYEEIKNKYAGRYAKICLTGHSLGGALALEVVYSYLNDQIQAYIFNSSFKISSPLKKKAVIRPGQVVSIEEKYDSVIGPLRFFWKTPEGIDRYKVDYVKQIIRGNHSRYNIAFGLLREANDNHVKAAMQIYDLNFGEQ